MTISLFRARTDDFLKPGVVSNPLEIRVSPCPGWIEMLFLRCPRHILKSQIKIAVYTLQAGLVIPIFFR
jgi:hypothetical protein